MPSFHVTYYYLATGMEGNADRRDHGIIEANTASEAKDKVVAREMSNRPQWEREFLKGCLTAKEVWGNRA